MARTQHILIDFENVCEIDLSRIVGTSTRVIVILGANQTKIPVPLVLFLQEHPEQLRIIQTPVDGRNALDFVLILELGRLIARDPDAYFHIISKDTDFDSVIRHLKKETPFVARRKSLAEIPALKSTAERVELLRANLANPVRSRPSTRVKLENQIRNALGPTVLPDIVDQTVTALIHHGLFTLTDTNKIVYPSAA